MGKFLVVGLGSMGKRRVRCLLALGIKKEDIFGVDIRADRCREAVDKYGINIVNDIEKLAPSDLEAVIVSLPPDRHKIGTDLAVKYRKSVFVEASVVLAEVKAIKESGQDIFIAPSCTFWFHPMIKEIRKIIADGRLGKISNFSDHSGQYLPDWHSWEDVKDFYVSHRETGGAREIVPYELTWMTKLFGFPKNIKGYFRQTCQVGCDIEDTYVCCMDYGHMLGTLAVDVASRYPARNLIINCQLGQIQWRWDDEQIRVYTAADGQTTYIKQEKLLHEDGYAPMIGEQMYIDEIAAFLQGIKNPGEYPNTLDEDIKVLELLGAIEDSDGGF